jgi:hypothetical protein
MVPAVVLTAVLAAAAAEQKQQLDLTQSAPSSALMAMIAAGALARTPAEASARLDRAPAVLVLKLATTG